MSFIHFQNLGQILTIPFHNVVLTIKCWSPVGGCGWTWSFNFKRPARGVRAEKEDRKGGGAWLGGIGRGKQNTDKDK